MRSRVRKFGMLRTVSTALRGRAARRLRSWPATFGGTSAVTVTVPS